jgi:Methyltransferase domain
MPLLHSWDGGVTWNTGGFDRQHLEKLFGFLRDRLPDNPVLLETGAGNSTIAMLFLQPARLISIAPDAQLFERIRGFCQKNGISDTVLEAHTDGSQWVLPRLAADNRASDPILDFVLIDGCHGWPTAFVDLEYANSMLRRGGYLMIDDVNLYAEKEIARLLAEHKAFSLALDLGKSLVFRKLTADRHLGEWVDQPYVVRRTAEYARFPHSYSLGDPPALYLTKMPYWMKRLLGRLRHRI